MRDKEENEEENDMNIEESAEKYFLDIIEKEEFESFRPFAFVCDDFCIRVNSNGEYHEVNIAAVGKIGEEFGCFSQSLNSGVNVEVKEEEEEEGGEVEEKGGKKKKKK